MEVAREEIYYPTEVKPTPSKSANKKLQKNKQRKKLQKQNKEMQKKYRREKLFFCAMILMISIISLGLLLRYVMITEARHDIHRLNAAITELKNDERTLRIEVESLARSNRVEMEATERLKMIYPDTREVNYIQVDTDEVNRITNHLEGFDNRIVPSQGFMERANENLRQWLSRVEALF